MVKGPTNICYRMVDALKQKEKKITEKKNQNGEDILRLK